MTADSVVYRFDPLLRSSDGALSQTIATFRQYLAKQEAKRGGRVRSRKAADQAKFDLAVECLLVNLTAAVALFSEAVVAVPLSNTVLRGRPRYRPDVYGTHFRDLIRMMDDLKLIAIVTKGFNVRQWRRRELTTIRPTAKLAKMFPSIRTSKLDAASLKRVEQPEVVILKDAEGQLVDYDETGATRQWREELRAINRFLENAPISLVSQDGIVDEEGFVVRPGVRSLRRIWNNSDWGQGGRLYDAFWQTMKREDRLRAVLIDGEPIANVDFSQFNLRLAYALAKARPPRGDLYDITGDDGGSRDWPKLREGRKKLTNAMFNRNAPLKGWPGDTPADRQALAASFPPGTSAQAATRAIRERHAAIAKYFESGQGLGLMRIESDILVASLLSLIRRNIVALPIHDAVLVPERFALAAKRTLERESKKRIGAIIPAEIKTLAD